MSRSCHCSFVFPCYLLILLSFVIWVDSLAICLAIILTLTTSKLYDLYKDSRHSKPSLTHEMMNMYAGVSAEDLDPYNTCERRLPYQSIYTSFHLISCSSFLCCLYSTCIEKSS